MSKMSNFIKCLMSPEQWCRTWRDTNGTGRNGMGRDEGKNNKNKIAKGKMKNHSITLETKTFEKSVPFRDFGRTGRDEQSRPVQHHCSRVSCMYRMSLISMICSSLCLGTWNAAWTQLLVLNSVCSDGG